MSKRAYWLIFVFIWLFLPLPFQWYHESTKPATLRIARTGNGKSVSYFVTGLLGQPEPAFQFLLNEPILQHDTIVFADYTNSGVNFAKLSKLIQRDIISHGYTEIKIFGISVGCAITHSFNTVDTAFWFDYLTHHQNIPTIKCYEINPCWSSQFLQPQLQGTLPRLGLILLQGLDFLSGPLKFLPVIKHDGQNFSLHLLTGQLTRIMRKTSLTQSSPKYTQFVILSENDEFLNNQVIREYYQDVPVITLPGVAHARTGIDANAHDYLQAFQYLLMSRGQGASAIFYDHY